MTTLRWRMLLSIFSVFALMAVSVACGDDDDDDTGDGGTTPGSGSTTQAGNTPDGDGGDAQEGGEITIQYLDVQSWDPHFSSFSQDIGHHGFVWRGLYKLNKDNEPKPEMAEDMPEISDDQKTYTVKLKSGLEWSDGDDLTADDFVAGIHRTCDPDNAGQYQYILSNIVGCDDFYNANGDPEADPPVAAKSDAEKEQLREAIGVRAVDPSTIEFKLLNPQPTWTTILSLWMTYPVPTHLVSTSGEAWPTDPTTLAFNGPFVLESYTAKQGAVFVRNESYAGEHQAYLDRVELRYIEDNAQSNNAFRSNEIQAAIADTSTLKSLQGEFPDNLFSYTNPTTISLQMQMEQQPLDNDQFRLALSRAIDRETLANDVLQGAMIPTTTWIPADVVGIEEGSFGDEIGFDPEEARRLLDESGVTDTSGMSILIRDTPANKATAEFLQAEFREHLDIEVDIEIVDAPTRSRRFTTEEFTLFPGGWHQDYPDPENWIIGQFDREGTLNHFNCFDEEIDSLIKEARFNSDNEERLEQYREINEMISTRVCGGAPMYHQGNHILISDELGDSMREFSSSQDRLLPGDWTPEDWSLDD